MDRSYNALALGLVAALGLIVGCVETKTAAPAPVPTSDGMDTCSITVLVNKNQAPKWLTQKGPAFSGDRAVFYGVGNVAGTHNAALRRRGSEQQARADIASTFNTYIARLQKQYLANVTAGSMDKASEEQHIQDVMKALTEQTLVGADIVEYWDHPCMNRNEGYALARLDLAKFQDAASQLQATNARWQELDAKIKQQILEHSKEAHDDLAAELDKRRASQ